MIVYHVCTLDNDGLVSRRTPVRCADDAQAIIAARALLRPGTLAELRQGGRSVGRVSGPATAVVAFTDRTLGGVGLFLAVPVWAKQVLRAALG